jgi:TetR/AcrR family transcriptional regulator
MVEIFSNAILGVAPHLKGTKMLKPVTMSLFGMINWHYLWFKSTGSVTRSDYADLVTKLIADGARGILAQNPKLSKRAAAAE